MSILFAVKIVLSRFKIISPVRTKHPLLMFSAPFLSKLILKYSFQNYKKYYRELIDECKKEELNKAVTYLKNAETEFYNTKENPIILGGRPLLANSPIERVMREVDRRADIGSRWSAVSPIWSPACRIAPSSLRFG